MVGDWRAYSLLPRFGGGDAEALAQEEGVNALSSALKTTIPPSDFTHYMRSATSPRKRVEEIW